MTRISQTKMFMTSILACIFHGEELESGWMDV